MLPTLDYPHCRKQFGAVTDNTACLVGHVEGIAAGAVADLPDLELLTGEEHLLLA